ncbi:hypothetical protein BK666_24645 [Pseudomonas frederiksbergensis]|uniref:Uncharacterized protein n=1 Tax=Pseudomonas frederiksbergensis TaxID=104087 RepID=A0A423JUQ2_9PSED|nr:hypothetical protein [Pseudomonas frederiksbergensis]RON41397.1 hypothetical protein BK666_24645 [Pseudomonas frederiksbergensis]
MNKLTRRALVIVCAFITRALLALSLLAPLTYLVGLAFNNFLTTYVHGIFPFPPYPTDHIGGVLWIGGHAIIAIVMFAILWGAARGVYLASEYLRVGSAQGVREALQAAAAAQQAKAEAARKANEEELGTLISISVHASRPITLVETDQGFYSIRGIPTKALKGSAIRRIGRDLVIDHGQGNTQRYPLFAE